MLKKENLSFNDLWWLSFWRDLWHDKVVLLWFLTLSNVSFCLSLRGPSAELHAGCSPPPPVSWPGAFGAEHPPAWVIIYQTNDEKTIGRSDKKRQTWFFFAIINYVEQNLESFGISSCTNKCILFSYKNIHFRIWLFAWTWPDLHTSVT